MKDRCSAEENSQQCRATTKLTRVQIRTSKDGFSNLVLPEYVLIKLCKKHFVFTDDFAQRLKRFND